LISTTSNASIQRSADLILNAQYSVALTGAGISTPSGIPDFRSQDSGLWEHFDPMSVASLTSFRYNPENFFEWITPLVRTIINAQPNAAHHALADLERHGHIQSIVTQNIDNLHHRAGSDCVHEIHGHMREASCIACFKCFPTKEFLRSFVEEGIIPRCVDCGGILKPNIVLFGEQLPGDVVRAASGSIEQADLIVVVGSSLEVTPAAILPIPALNRGARLIILNREATYLDERADVIIQQDVAVSLPKIAEAVLRER
jgi:NAD-dependent deacetylase